MVQENKIFKLAIDGPSGVGKSTTANVLAEKLGFVRIDSGTLYRALTHILLEKFGPLNDDILLSNEEETKKVEFVATADSIIYNNENIKSLLKTAPIDKNVSVVAKHSFIREKIKKMQYQWIDELEREGCKGIIIDGRDIGTVILPNATLKIYLNAYPEVRAKRRLQEIADGKYEEVLAAMLVRDREDIERKHGPLKKADDAIEIDNSYMTFDEQITAIYELVVDKMINK